MQAASPSRDQALTQLVTLQRRNLQLWAVTTIVMVSLAAGFLLLSWTPDFHPAEWMPSFLPQALVGLVVLVVLLSAYVLQQKHRAAVAERELFGKMAMNTGLPDILDTETQVFRREFLDYAIAQESTMAATDGTPTSIVLVRAYQFVPKDRRGIGDDHSYIRHAAYLLRRTFRGADTIVRESDSTFLLLLSNTTSEEARCALYRLAEFVEKWNLSTRYDYELAVSWNLAACTPGDDLAAAVDTLRMSIFPELSAGGPAEDPRAVSQAKPFAALAGLSI